MERADDPFAVAATWLKQPHAAVPAAVAESPQLTVLIPDQHYRRGTSLYGQVVARVSESLCPADADPTAPESQPHLFAEDLRSGIKPGWQRLGFFNGPKQPPEF